MLAGKLAIPFAGKMLPGLAAAASGATLTHYLHLHMHAVCVYEWLRDTKAVRDLEVLDCAGPGGAASAVLLDYALSRGMAVAQRPAFEEEVLLPSAFLGLICMRCWMRGGAIRCTRCLRKRSPNGQFSLR